MISLKNVREICDIYLIRSNANNLLRLLTFLSDSLREKVVTDSILLKISDDVGRCVRRLGIQLGLDGSIVSNIMKDEQYSSEKAMTMLQKWTHKEGRNATIGILADALEAIEEKIIADKLLGMYPIYP